MKEELSIDELLNGFVDGELTERQETEIRRLIENDPQIAQRLQQLQKCKILMSSLPAVEAPSRISDGIKAALKAKTLHSEQRPVLKEQTGTRTLLAQRLVAVAALIGLAVVLTAVMYTVAPPETTPDIFGPAESSPGVAAEAVFRGRLEMKSSEFIAVDSFVKRMIEDNGFSESLSSIQEPSRRIYFLSCSKEGLNRLLANLDKIWWDKLDSATLLINTDVFGEQIMVEAVTPEQIAEIAGQNDSGRSVEVAKDYAVLNGMAERVQGIDILSVIEGRTADLMTIHKPFLTQWTIEKPEIREEGEKTVHLTLIVSR